MCLAGLFDFFVLAEALFHVQFIKVSTRLVDLTENIERTCMFKLCKH